MKQDDELFRKELEQLSSMGHSLDFQGISKAPEVSYEHSGSEQHQMMQQIEEMRRLGQAFRQFSEDKVNELEIDSPSRPHLGIIMRLWKARQKKTERFLLTLKLKDCQISREQIQAHFSSLPSIRVILNGEALPNEGILKQDGDYFYEGCNKEMTIICEARQTYYIGQTQNLRYHGRGQLHCDMKKEFCDYVGTFQNGKRHGYGQQKEKNSVYSGTWKDDYKDGKGLEIILKKRKKGQADGLKVKSIYQGPFKVGQKEGEEGIEIIFKGQKLFDDIQVYLKKGCEAAEKEETVPHSIYIGSWKQDLKHGEGSIKYQNDDTYEGHWERGQISGQGKYHQFQNCTYIGEFRNGKYHGNGTMEYKNGDRYEGEFDMGKKHGQGKYDYSDGDYYDGEWKNDSADGQGTLMIGNDFFVGQMKNGKKHGQGEFSNEEGDTIIGVWENNKLIKIIEKNGEPYQGQVEDA